MAAMATPPLGPSNSECLSCIPYRDAVLSIAGVTMLASVCDIVFGMILIFYDYKIYVFWFAWTSIAQGVLGFLMSTLLIVGILKEGHGSLLTYIIGMILNAMFYFGNGAVMLTQRYWYGDNVYYGVWAMFWSVIILYFVTVVADYRTWMMQRRAAGRIPVYLQYNHPVPAQGMMFQPGTVINQPMVSTVSGQIGYVQSAQPGTYLPPGTYQPTGTHQLQGTYLPQGTYQPQGSYLPQGTYQPQGSYLPQGTYLPHGTHLAQETQISPGVQTHPAGHKSPEPSSLPKTDDSSEEDT